ncbi:MAG: DMT family transporter [Rhizobiaceae bacterium]|nr:DMT family transporter [Rhizobiaceae bacterium]MCV0404654.1 DMT family transporter [Rhizobiaceae bacterium]
MHRQAYMLLLLTALFWAGNAIAGKLAVGHISPLTLSVARWGVACALLSAAGWRHFRRDWFTIRNHLPLLAGLGFFGFTVFSVALYSALHFTTAINAAILQAGMPAVIFVANFLVFRMSVGVGQVAGFLLSLLGVALVVTAGNPLRLLLLDVNAGDALLILAVAVYSGYSVALRRKPNIHWMSFMIALTGAAFVTGLPFMAFEVAAGSFFWPDMRGWIILAAVAIFPSLLGQAFYVRGVGLIGANRAGLFINLVPIFGTLLSIVILGERFALHHALALALVLGGIWMAEHSGRKGAAR